MKLGSNGTSALQGLLQSPNLNGWRVQTPSGAQLAVGKSRVARACIRIQNSEINGVAFQGSWSHASRPQTQAFHSLAGLQDKFLVSLFRADAGP